MVYLYCCVTFEQNFDALNYETVSRWRRAPPWRWVTSWPRSTPRAQVTGAVARVWRLERGACVENSEAL